MSARVDLPIDEMVARYAAGGSTHAIARTYGVAAMTVWRRLVTAGVEMRGCGWFPLGNKYGLGNTGIPGGPRYIDENGYLRARDREGKRCRVHRACWQAHHGPIPQHHIVHHINSDPLDNRIENLSCMTQAEHVRLHADARRAE